jgi:hypothetical protein
MKLPGDFDEHQGTCIIIPQNSTPEAFGIFPLENFVGGHHIRISIEFIRAVLLRRLSRLDELLYELFEQLFGGLFSA